MDSNPEDRGSSQKDCDESHLVPMSAQLAGQTIAPFLQHHVPAFYAPIGKPDPLLPRALRQKRDPNTKYCYRHSPDSKCRRGADETKMAEIQRKLDQLPMSDRQAITHVWSLFSAAPSKHRELMLQGVLTQCCFPQLSVISREVEDQLKIDFLAALPTEIALKILCYLDTISLCKAAQVSHRWRLLADDNLVWHVMCSQHIDRKCTKCGWGLPLLERKKLQEWSKRQKQKEKEKHTGAAAATSAHPTRNASPMWSLDSEGASPSSALTLRSPSQSPVLSQHTIKRRRRESSEGSAAADPPAKRTCSQTPSLERESSAQTEQRTFKSLYKERFMIGTNWKYGRCALKTFRGHSNGVTCLQFDDAILATGSYDNTIKIWDVESGRELRTLRGHTRVVRALQFDDAKLISASLDGTLKIWNWQTGECINTLVSDGMGVLTLHYEDKWLISGSMGTDVRLFNFETRRHWCFKGHRDSVNHVRLDLASRTFFSASNDLTVKLWDMDTKECIRTFVGHVGQVQQILLVPDAFDFDPLSLNYDREADELPLIHGPEPSADVVRALFGPGFVSPQQQQQQCPPSEEIRPLPPRYMLTAGLDNTIRLWEVATGICIRTMFGHLEGIWSLAGDNLHVITGAHDSLVKVWELRTGRCERTFAGHQGPCTAVGLSDSRMASGSEDGEVRMYFYDNNHGPLESRGKPS